MQLAIFPNIFVRTVFDGSINPILLKVDIHIRYTMMRVSNIRFKKKNSIGNCKFMQDAFFCKYIYALGFD